MVDQIIALLGTGDRALAAEVISTLGTTPVTTFVTLLITEERKQAEDANKGVDNVVYDNQCKK
ncbi:MAG: hypothetical protein JWQ07_3859 [Ramlibacter sp.]|nr:hypothetical protein [Ramlibacter sp.]